MGKDKNSKKDRKDKKRKRDKEDEEDHRKAKAEKLVSVILYTSNLLHWLHPAFAPGMHMHQSCCPSPLQGASRACLDLLNLDCSAGALSAVLLLHAG